MSCTSGRLGVLANGTMKFYINADNIDEVRVITKLSIRFVRDGTLAVSQSTSHGYDIVVEALVQLHIPTLAGVVEVERVRHIGRVEAITNQIKFSELKSYVKY